MGQRLQPFRSMERDRCLGTVLAELQAQSDALGEIDWEIHFVDGSVVRAH